MAKQSKQTNFSELSCKLTKQIDKNDKKKEEYILLLVTQL